MSLDGILSIADSGIASVNHALSVIGQNVANASTAGWTREIANDESSTAAGQGMGVRITATTRTTQPQLQAAVLAQTATIAGAQTEASALTQIDAAQGTTGAGDDVASLLGTVQDRLVTLEQDPSNAAAQQQAVGAAQDFATRLNTLSGAVGVARQSAQDDAVSQVAALNTALAGVGALSNQIFAAQAAGQDTADLQNQRDAAVAVVAQIVPVSAATQADGTFLLISGGLVLPTGGGTPFALAAATTGAGVAYPGTLPGVTLGGRDVTAQLGDGALGADISLRDKTLPAQQAGLDQLSQTVSTRFQAQGLSLFTDAGGTVPSSAGPPTQLGYLGYASTIQVDPAVANDPSLVRDGTGAIAGSATGASAFTPNPVGGPAGSTTLIARILTYAFGTEAQAGVAQPATPTTGLGAGGTVSLAYAAPAAIGQFAASLVGSMSGDVAQANARLGDAQALGTTLGAKLQTAGGVSIDTEMSTMVMLQNAYAANAKVIGAVQSMWSTLIAMVQP